MRVRQSKAKKKSSEDIRTFPCVYGIVSKLVKTHTGPELFVQLEGSMLLVSKTSKQNKIRQTSKYSETLNFKYETETESYKFMNSSCFTVVT